MSLIRSAPQGIVWKDGHSPTTGCWPQSGIPLPPLVPGGVPLAQVFDYHVTGSDLTTMASQRYLCWGNTTIVPGTFNSVYTGNSRSNSTATTLAWFKANTPDWLAYRADQVTLFESWPYDDGEQSPNYYDVDLDVQNPNFRAYKLAWCQQQNQAGYNCMAFDNVGLTNLGTSGTGALDSNAGHFTGSSYDTNGNRLTGTWVQDYWGREYDDQPYSAAVIAYMIWMRSQLNALGIPLMANIQNPSAASEVLTYKISDLLRGCDIWLAEGVFQNSGQRTPLDADWVAYNQVTSNYAQNGGVWLACCYTSQSLPANLGLITQNEIAWIVGNFLLMRGPQSYLSPGMPSYFVQWPASFQPDIGIPLGPAGALPGGLWMRPYTNGWVVVNPSSTLSGTYTVPTGVWVDQFGNTVSSGSQTLAAQSAIVLLG